MRANPKQVKLQQLKSAARENGRTELAARSKSKLNHTDQTNKASHCLTHISLSTSHAGPRSHQIEAEITGSLAVAISLAAHTKQRKNQTHKRHCFGQLTGMMLPLEQSESKQINRAALSMEIGSTQRTKAEGKSTRDEINAGDQANENQRLGRL
jgi:hypothetical protein